MKFELPGASWFAASILFAATAACSSSNNSSADAAAGGDAFVVEADARDDAPVLASDAMVEAAPTISAFLAETQALGPNGGTTTLFWSVDNATSVSIDNSIGTVDVSGLQAVTVATTTTFTLTATSPGGTSMATVTITTAPLDVYVDVTNGLDSNDGTEAAPFQTIGKAENSVVPG